MGTYKCDLCDKSYGYERNLKRHVREAHGDIEHWNCAEPDRLSKFIRRSYLFKHLRLKHGYDKLRAHETACLAPRGNMDIDNYYDNESEDDSVFDLIADMDEDRYQQRYVDIIENFDSSLLTESAVKVSEDAPNPESEQAPPCDVQKTVNNYANTQNSTETIPLNNRNNNVLTHDDAVDVYCDGNYSNMNESDLDYFDVETINGILSDEDMTNIGETNNRTMNNKDYDNVVINEAGGDTNITDFKIGDESVKEVGKMVYSDISDVDVNVGENVDNDDLSGPSQSDEDGDIYDQNDSVIIISTDDEFNDERAVEASAMRTFTQTFVLTFRKQTKYIGDEVISTSISMEKDYYEHCG